MRVGKNRSDHDLFDWAWVKLHYILLFTICSSFVDNRRSAGDCRLVNNNVTLIIKPNHAPLLLLISQEQVSRLPPLKMGNCGELVISEKGKFCSIDKQYVKKAM